MQAANSKACLRLHSIWNDMCRRCTVPNRPYYNMYGGRGIKVCDEWLHDFDAFFSWALASGYRDDLTIDRIDVDGDYCPENCRWATRTVQNNNRRNNVLLTIGGDTKSVAQWSEASGVPYMTIYNRHKNGVCGNKLIEKGKRGGARHKRKEAAHDHQREAGPDGRDQEAEREKGAGVPEGPEAGVI